MCVLFLFLSLVLFRQATDGVVQSLQNSIESLFDFSNNL